MESYNTVSAFGSDEFTEKRSRFIGYAKPISTEEEALAFIAEIKQKHWDAKHNVYAYSVRNGNTKRFSDDGEPQGTAGMPVLNILTQAEVTDCVIVVTRYFGGILLGGGGLVRAYSHAAKIAVDAAGIITKKPWYLLTVSCDYTFYAKLESFIRDMGGQVENSAFLENVRIDFRIPQEKLEDFQKKAADLTNGKIIAEVTGETVA